MKWLKRLHKLLVSPFALGLLVTSGIVWLSADYYSRQHSGAHDQNPVMRAIEELHERTIDWRLADRGQIAGSDRVAILAIDEPSLDAEGHWPWSRDKMARLVDRTLEGGARAIAFDIIFSEEDAKSAIPTLGRMKRELTEKNQFNSDLDSVFSEELRRANSDLIFSNTIRNQADNLIMGAFFDESGISLPYQDLCIDALFSRTPESRYWSKEASPIKVIDPVQSRLSFPQDLAENLGGYFTNLEVTAANDWFDQHKGMSPKVSFALEQLTDIIPPEAFPGLATLWLNDDVESAQTFLADARQDLGTPEGVSDVFRRYNSAFSKPEAASLLSAIRNAGAKYCRRFFTEQDELLHLDKYKEKWGDSEESTEQFHSYSWASFWSKSQGANPDVKKEPLENAIARVKSESLPNTLLNVIRWRVNIPLLASGMKHSGYFNAVQDRDGSIRRSALTVRKGNRYMPSLALQLFLLDRGYQAEVKLDVEKKNDNTLIKVLKSFEVTDAQNSPVMRIPVDAKAQMMINYAGGSYMFPHIRASDLLSDDPLLSITQQRWDEASRTWQVGEMRVKKADFLKDKLLIAGATAMGLYDLRVTPFEKNYPGVETHANALSNLLTEDLRARGELSDGETPGFLRTHPQEERFMLIALIVIGLTLSVLLSYFGSLTGLAITVLALAGVYVFDRFFLFKSGVVTAMVFPTVLISANFVALTFYKYFTEERTKRELKGTFEKYVSPAIVNEVLSDPENIELGGKKMELTVMFSDVRGFTTISEKLDPRALSDLLNSYLTPMTNLVFKNKGTLDKYMGDAIMAFWGAPIHFQDHAKHACRCALQMIDKLKELQAEYRAKGLPEIDIGIGLNTGEMSVGNMGSDTVRSYTVMGDAVNLGSRLEGINKQYGTRIIISEFTFKAIKDSFVCREVDWVRVKGKAQPVRIFELIAEGKIDAKRAELLKVFNEGFDLYHAMKFEEAITKFTQALNIQSDDAVTQLYLERCQDYLSAPPPEDWDGVFTMTSK